MWKKVLYGLIGCAVSVYVISVVGVQGDTMMLMIIFVLIVISALIGMVTGK